MYGLVLLVSLFVTGPQDVPKIVEASAVRSDDGNTMSFSITYSNAPAPDIAKGDAERLHHALCAVGLPKGRIWGPAGYTTGFSLHGRTATLRISGALVVSGDGKVYNLSWPNLPVTGFCVLGKEYVVSFAEAPNEKVLADTQALMIAWAEHTAKGEKYAVESIEPVKNEPLKYRVILQ